VTKAERATITVIASEGAPPKKPRKRLSPEKLAANAAKMREQRREAKELREAEKWHWPAK